MKNLDEYHDLYLESDTLLFADVLENFRVRSSKISFSPRISMTNSFKNTKVKLELLTVIDMLLMVEKGIRGGLCNSINRYVKVNNEYMKDYDKNEELSYRKYWDVNSLYGWAISRKLPVNGFKWVEVTQLNENFIKSYNEESDEGYFLKLIFNILKIYIIFIMIYHFQMKE